jgi:hypothetical protein
MDHFQARGLAAQPFVPSLVAPQHGALAASLNAGRLARRPQRGLPPAVTLFGNIICIDGIRPGRFAT